jgi:hypothetical protein
VLGGAGGVLCFPVTQVVPVDVTRELEVCLFCHMKRFVIMNAADLLILELP